MEKAILDHLKVAVDKIMTQEMCPSRDCSPWTRPYRNSSTSTHAKIHARKRARAGVHCKVKPYTMVQTDQGWRLYIPLNGCNPRFELRVTGNIIAGTIQTSLKEAAQMQKWPEMIWFWCPRTPHNTVSPVLSDHLNTENPSHGLNELIGHFMDIFMWEACRLRE